MTKEFAAAIGLSIGLFALVSALPADALAQAGSRGASPAATDPITGKTSRTGASNADMRLWSFGECDKNFPDIATAAHRECVRVVGSDEAKDARAVHFCDLSHAKDPAEAVRCKQTYFANKAEAEHAGFRARPSNPPPAIVPVALAPRPDKAVEIAALTRALTAPDPEEPAPAAAPVPETAPAPAARPPSFSSFGTAMLALSIVLLLTVIAMRYLRRTTAAQAPARATPRKRGSPAVGAARAPSKRY